MSTAHQHHHINREGKESLLIIALSLSLTVLIAELIGGVLTQSLALISDAAHMLTDVSALFIALMAMKIAKRPVDDKRTFGYFRFEILAAAFNTIMLFLVSFYVFYEAYKRLAQPPEIYSKAMLWVALLGLAANLISMRLLSGHGEKNINLRTAYIEAWSDMLGSLGVVMAALVIQFTGLGWVDSLIAVLIGLWILPRTWSLLKESINILLEGVPKGMDMAELIQVMKEVDGVIDIHDLHVWALTSDKINLTAHVIIEPRSHQELEEILAQLRKLLLENYHISHTTFQLEVNPCEENLH